METNTQTLIHNVDKELPVPVLVENSDYWPHWYDKLKFGVVSDLHTNLVFLLYINFKALYHGKGYGVFAELLYIFQGKDDGLCRAPDCMIVEDADTTITDRNSYNQQTERGCPVIIFEVLSKSNTNASQKRLLRDYWQYPSLQEVFFISKDLSRIEIYQRNGNPDWWHEYVMQEGDRFTSPTLGFIITYKSGKATFFTPDETPFKEFLELKAELAEAIVLQKETEEYASDALLKAFMAETKAIEEAQRAAEMEAIAKAEEEKATVEAQRAAEADRLRIEAEAIAKAEEAKAIEEAQRAAEADRLRLEAEAIARAEEEKALEENRLRIEAEAIAKAEEAKATEEAQRAAKLDAELRALKQKLKDQGLEL